MATSSTVLNPASTRLLAPCRADPRYQRDVIPFHCKTVDVAGPWPAAASVDRLHGLAGDDPAHVTQHVVQTIGKVCHPVGLGLAVPIDHMKLSRLMALRQSEKAVVDGGLHYMSVLDSPGGLDLDDRVAEVPEGRGGAVHPDQQVGAALESRGPAQQRHVLDVALAAGH